MIVRRYDKKGRCYYIDTKTGKRKTKKAWRLSLYHRKLKKLIRDFQYTKPLARKILKKYDYKLSKIYKMIDKKLEAYLNKLWRKRNVKKYFNKMMDVYDLNKEDIKKLYVAQMKKWWKRAVEDGWYHITYKEE